MSGSGGFGGYELPAREKFDCLFSSVAVKVSSIDLNVLAELIVGNILELEISNSGSLILIDGNGQTLGSIMHHNTSDIINCIKQGNNYHGVVINITSPTCTVEITRV
ncbi:hypothetical protein ACFU8T_19160 [Sphingobacterium spiritivorum]|uniref:Uncharacterized protein n=1 Tax=Sphingobacterium spiritivorum ATCC 33861 TaxID=525373 RepID=D7VTP7_SPHSI|nr:hypothetical protein [Sphingobacterium spiritivorum]EFK55806.1 hypothetical protein HMPREF0766_14367 [Sphingobacterium spiritivorum ATCC 33861]QQT37288.1 hypothetical protein I6J01_07740 [Sphingobacterium spiritivorum]WQD34071.1 hypothetical protein U0038_21455 [Sphingobacterium spiritivorum]SUJ29401.1 Uncharacterised protein [Sphingobacterium spiritivorum]